MSAEFVNISAYKFVTLDRLAERREVILNLAKQLELKGTVLLAEEGINLFVAGEKPNIDQFVAYFDSCPEYQDLPIKESPSDHQPFSRMLVRIKKEIIAFGVETVNPRDHTSRKIQAEELKKWLDDQKEVVLLDVRNDYEVELGTFVNALPIGVDHFRDFPAAVKQIPDEAKKKPLVMFCTGGIRCEKAGPLMEQEGFENVFQLDGGILRYFEEVGGQHYDGECFVFDKRVAVDPDLNETPTTQCYACQHPLSAEDQKDSRYQPPTSCPFCYQTESEKMAVVLAERQQKLDEYVQVLPGSVPYDNFRPLNVPGKFDRMTLLDFLDAYHPHVGRPIWLEKIQSDLIQRNRAPANDPEMIVRGGQRFEHRLPQQVEPGVNPAIKLIHEDSDLIVVEKPAPLPMHPCGRFNRNTLVYLLSHVYDSLTLKVTHRLDAETTGVVVLARKSRIAKELHRQFLECRVSKGYLALVEGHPDWETKVSTEPISKSPGEKGSRRLDDSGLEAETSFERLEILPDGKCLVACSPKTGRTNQIRIHLAGLGFPIVGDPVYGPKRSSESERLHLHADSIEFIHPGNGKPVKFSARKPNWAG